MGDTQAEVSNSVINALENIKEKLKVFEDDRERSFITWKFAEHERCSKSEMAKAGFYFCGNMEIDDDSATCFLCGKVLDGWEPTDEPWIEHQKHSANCKFVQMRRCEDELTVEEMLDLCKHVIKKHITKKHQAHEAHFLKEAERIRTMIQNQQF